MNIKNWIIHKLGGITKDELFNQPLCIETRTADIKHYKVKCMLNNIQAQQIPTEDIRKQLYMKLANEMYLDKIGELYSDEDFSGYTYMLFADVVRK